MPPKVKITREDIITTALALLREGGEGAVNARSVAAALGCSTQPVFSNFATMEALQEAVLAAAYEIYLAYLQAEAEKGVYPRYKAFGMAYTRFAREEKALFKLLFMRDRQGEELTPTEDFRVSVEMLVQANALSREQAERMHLEMWTCVHGIAVLLATSFITLEEDLISGMITDVYQGLQAKHAEKR